MNDLISIFIPRLNDLRLPYMVTGSVAVMLLGEMRNTLDIDLVLAMPPAAVGRVVSAFPEMEFYLPPPEVLVVEAARRTRGHFNIIHHQTGARADVYLHADDPFQQWALTRTVVTEIDAIPVRFAPVEYTILMKLEFFREGGSEKHLRDIAGVMANAVPIRSAEVQPFVVKMGLTDLWHTHVESRLA